MLHDEQLAEYASSQQALPGAHVDYASLAAALSSLSPAPCVLLLYALLLKHPSFLEGLLLLPEALAAVLDTLLMRLYDAQSLRGADQVYALLIDALLLVQDSRVRVAMSAPSPARDWRWYRERPLRGASAADLLVLCTLRTTVLALFNWRDAYALSHCGAVLLNAAPALVGIHVYVAERLVETLCKLGRRLLRAGDALDAPVRETLELLLRVVATVAGAEGGTRNVNMLYALVQAEAALVSSLEPLSDLSASGRFVLSLAREYLEALAEGDAGGGLTDATRVAERLRGLLTLRPVAPPPDPTAPHYAYEEDPGADSFFVPCAWAAACDAKDLPLLLDRIVIFDPVAYELLPPSAPPTAEDDIV